jgi:hypothetical protein
MFTIIGGANVEYGPVPASQVNAWIAGGRANLQTKAKKFGTDDWKTLGDFPEFSPAAAPTPPPLAGDGVTPSTPADPQGPTDKLFARAPKLGVGACLSRGWDLWIKHFGRLVLVTFVFFLICAAIVCIRLQSDYLAIALAFLLGGMLTAGMFRYTLKLLRNEPAELSDLFAGFSEAPGSLIRASLLIGFVSELPFLLSQISPELLPTQPVYWAIQLFVVYLSVGWAFTYPLILEKRLAFWPAMQASRHAVRGNWWRFFFLMIIAMLLSILGMIALFIGVFLTLPLYFCVLACAYDALCNPPART